MKLAEALSLDGLIVKLTEEESNDKGFNRASEEKVIKVYTPLKL